MTYLPKKLRNALDDFDTEAFDHYLKTGNYATLIRLYDLVCEKFKEGHPMNEWHMEVLSYPMKLWGKRFGQVLYELRQSYWLHFKDRDTKPEPEKKTREQYEDKLKAFRCNI